MIHVIIRKSLIFNLFHGEVGSQLMNDRGYHFEMSEFFCRYIGKNRHADTVRSGEPLGEVAHRGTDLAVRVPYCDAIIFAIRASVFVIFTGYCNRFHISTYTNTCLSRIFPMAMAASSIPMNDSRSHRSDPLSTVSKRLAYSSIASRRIPACLW